MIRRDSRDIALDRRRRDAQRRPRPRLLPEIHLSNDGPEAHTKTRCSLHLTFASLPREAQIFPFDAAVMAGSSAPPCRHEKLWLVPSSSFSQPKYSGPTPLGLTEALGPPDIATLSSCAKVTASRLDPKDADRLKRDIQDSASFPAPLVFPGDDLALDPEWPEHDLKMWLEDEDRNEVTKQRRTVYLVAPPAVAEEVGFVDGWADPNVGGGSNAEKPRIHELAEYIAAVFRGLPVRLFPKPLRFTPWDDEEPPPKSKRGPRVNQASSCEPSFIGLETGDECVRIRTRKPSDRLFNRQINLDDILDAAITMVPIDAYAVCMLVHHDLWENDEDDFTCGRAYGGSRVAVISDARYHAALDDMENIDRAHAWPASHCQEYVKDCCAVVGSKGPSRGRKARTKSSAKLMALMHSNNPPRGPIHKAVEAFNSLPALDASSATPKQLADLWLGRLCRTMTHELGHCFGIDHCVYYACMMQGTASSAEDNRQPPYLCPIDTAKVLRATGTGLAGHYMALLKFCERRQDSHLFAAFAAWLRARVESLDESNQMAS